MNNINGVTSQFYSVANQTILEVAKAEKEMISDLWAGFKQWLDAGRVVKKGEKATKIVMVVEKKQKDGSKKAVPKMACVFNIEQTEKLEA